MKHWIFDLDGTLVDTVDHYALKLRRIFAYFEVPLTPDDLEKARHYFDARRFFSLYFDDSDIDRACQLLNQFSLELAPQAKPFDGIVNLLHYLQNQNVQLNIWTGRDKVSTQKILELCGLDHFFKYCITGSCVSKKKPDPEGLLKVLNLSKFQLNDTIMVGDHAYDIKGARSVGVKALSVSWKTQSPHPLESVSDEHFYNTSDLTKWAQSQIEY